MLSRRYSADFAWARSLRLRGKICRDRTAKYPAQRSSRGRSRSRAPITETVHVPSDGCWPLRPRRRQSARASLHRRFPPSAVGRVPPKFVAVVPPNGKIRRRLSPRGTSSRESRHDSTTLTRVCDKERCDGCRGQRVHLADVVLQSGRPWRLQSPPKVDRTRRSRRSLGIL